jgi:uncharacterized membrane protein
VSSLDGVKSTVVLRLWNVPFFVGRGRPDDKIFYGEDNEKMMRQFLVDTSAARHCEHVQVQSAGLYMKGCNPIL